MLKNLKKYENLGTLNFFIELADLFRKNQELRKDFINKYFFNRVIDGKYIFDGWYALLTNIGLINIDYDGYLTTSDKFISNEDSPIKFAEVILLAFLSKYSKDEFFLEIFSQKNLNFDLSNKTLRIKRYAFSAKNINLLDFLLTLNFLVEDMSYSDFLIINHSFNGYFIEHAGRSINSSQSIENLLKIQEKQRELGELAERFVLKFEQERISSDNQVLWISPIDTTKGFDILSCENKQCIKDRYVEVKSYSNEKSISFFWSKNEINVAKENQDKYFLYLVDRSRINSPSYTPSMIKNPYKFFFVESNDWDKYCSNWFFRKN